METYKVECTNFSETSLLRLLKKMTSWIEERVTNDAYVHNIVVELEDSDQKGQVWRGRIYIWNFESFFKMTESEDA